MKRHGLEKATEHTIGLALGVGVGIAVVVPLILWAISKVGISLPSASSTPVAG